MKKETNINSNAKTAKRGLNEGLKRKWNRWKELHPDSSNCTRASDHRTSNDFSLNDPEVTSSYSNNDAIQKEADNIISNKNEFSSLIFMSKRINQETNDEYVTKFLKQIGDAKTDTKNTLMEEHKSHFSSIEECLEVIKRNTPQLSVLDSKEESEPSQSQNSTSRDTKNLKSDDLFNFTEKHSDSVEALQSIFARVTGGKTSTSSFSAEDDNITLTIDVDDDISRNLLQVLSKVTLPEIHTLKIENFYESDEDLENFLVKSLSSVWNFIFISESFWVDIHDYLTSILKITWLKNLYLKGFMIDGEDWERIFSAVNIQCVTFESWNLGIEEDFSIDESLQFDSNATKSILTKIRLVDSEMDQETVGHLLKAIKKSTVKDTLNSIELLNWELKAADVQSVCDRLGLNVIVQ